uniref:Neprosin domain-containing protein n=1 Tax=Setaria viridis TaxID=4556 RepID=A0A4U6VA89_SETVI|nr:hypothetical protein SEVIR_3G173650v2 [Setaria viridis]TKW26230.1 hypothetical protein SEVIR_3G173650v2 [Setaria viridis]
MCSCIAGQLLLWQMCCWLGLLPKEICPGIHLHNHTQRRKQTFDYNVINITTSRFTNGAWVWAGSYKQ